MAVDDLNASRQKIGEAVYGFQADAPDGMDSEVPHHLWRNTTETGRYLRSVNSLEAVVAAVKDAGIAFAKPIWLEKIVPRRHAGGPGPPAIG